MRASVLLGLAMATGGCVGPLGLGNENTSGAFDPPEVRDPMADPFLGHSVNWTQPGLYGAFPEPGTYDTWRINKTIPKFRLAPFGDPANETWVKEVSMRRDRNSSLLDGSFLLRTDRDNVPFVRAAWPADMSDADARASFVRFARNVTAAEDATIGAWADALLANASGNGTSRGTTVRVQAPFRFDALVEGLLAEPGARVHGTAPSRVMAGGWTVSIGSALKQAESSTETARFSISVDPQDRFGYGWQGRGPDVSAKGAAAKLNATFDALGLDPPAPPDWQRFVEPPHVPPEGTPRFQLARWNQSGIFGQLPGEGARGGYQFVRQLPEDGIPVGTGGEPFEDLVLSGVDWTLANRSVRFVLHPDLELLAAVDPPHVSSARSLFVEWARNVSSADDATIEEWADEFEREAASRPERFVSSITIEGPFRFGELLQDLEDRGDLGAQHGLSDVTYVSDQWSFRFQVPTRAAMSVERGGYGYPSLSIGATSRDQVALARNGLELLSDEELQALAREVFDDLDLGEPTFDGWRSEEYFPD